ncbi:hypothetical protein L345_17591, partial [Ophiophagus hannah]
MNFHCIVETVILEVLSLHRKKGRKEERRGEEKRRRKRRKEGSKEGGRRRRRRKRRRRGRKEGRKEDGRVKRFSESDGPKPTHLAFGAKGVTRTHNLLNLENRMRLDTRNHSVLLFPRKRRARGDIYRERDQHLKEEGKDATCGSNSQDEAPWKMQA